MTTEPQRPRRAHEAASASGAAGTAATAAIRVLLLSDQPIVAWGLEQLINSRQPTMTVAATTHSVAEALRLTMNQSADIVLLDLDGDIGTRDIAGLLDDGRTRVLALTTSHDPAFCDEAVLAGASGVVNKRDAASLLLKAIEKVHAGEFWLDRVATGRVFVAIARQRAGRDPEQEKIARLTRKERLTVCETARDASATGHEIAQRLCISEHTLRNHLSSIYSKLGLRNRMQLYAYANKHHLVATSRVRDSSPVATRTDPAPAPATLRRTPAQTRSKQRPDSRG